jgi:hypothetical protein
LLLALCCGAVIAFTLPKSPRIHLKEQSRQSS